MLCLPSAITELAFDASNLGADKEAESYTFAFYLASMAVRMFGHRLEQFSFNSGHDKLLRQETEGAKITSEDIMNFQCLRRLALAPTFSSQETFNVFHAHLDLAQVPEFSTLRIIETLRTLEIWNTQLSSIVGRHSVARQTELQKVVSFAQTLKALRLLKFKNIGLTTQGVQPRIRTEDESRELSSPVWLSFAISLRRAVATKAALEFEDVYYQRMRNTQHKISNAALTWVMIEAVPVGAEIDFAREERLHEDFESFLPLWEAEDSERGTLAAAERKGGALVDAAMCSRWRQFSNVRRDKGEWSTM
ncbi:hypothetical protein BAUCODRAFT_36089 [Baudoinia panamericana UAMH 10762]|uniref:Uncharacterized protein n=1 Tax=Baudoinia panamericana (strain UAMH 10762) TaxID=717646 RepID=M2LKL9_BAUPA|nr:uncharacterized protein BAUCODRAFT_36089 [Baudoinia panamericana UAMH 10762]EMC94827.1 hypothetical protein BAUCODRAFT_36089 [Baudoinia panamericana UAMH 10762]